MSYHWTKGNHCFKVSIADDNINGTEMQIKINLKLLHTLLDYIREETTRYSRRDSSIEVKSRDPKVLPHERIESSIT